MKPASWMCLHYFIGWLPVIFRDSAFAADADKINVTEILKNLSPDTKVRVI